MARTATPATGDRARVGTVRVLATAPAADAARPVARRGPAQHPPGLPHCAEAVVSVDVSARERLCRSCGLSFGCDAEFFLQRGLDLPTRCQWCREARRRERLTGVVDVYFVDREFGFIAADTGGRFFVTEADLGTDNAVVLTRGLRVTFMPAPGSPNPRARRVELLRECT